LYRHKAYKNINQVVYQTDRFLDKICSHTSGGGYGWVKLLVHIAGR